MALDDGGTYWHANSLNGRRAIVTGADFSPPALDVAREQVSALSMACAAHDKDKAKLAAERDHALMNLRMLQGKLVL